MKSSMMPGMKVAQRELNFYLLADTSSSMRGAYIQSLNYAMSQIIPHLKKMSKNNAGNNAPIFVRAMKFDQKAEWVDEQLKSVEDYAWTDLQTGMGTFIGEAFKLLAKEFEEIATRRILPPVVVLISDGCANDDYKAGLKLLMDSKIGKTAIKMAIAIGEETDSVMLNAFIGNQEIPILHADSSEKIINYITWASLSAVKSSMLGGNLKFNAQDIEGKIADMNIELFDA